MDKNSPLYLPGFSLGITSLQGKSDRVKFVAGTFASFSQIRYHYLATSSFEDQGFSGSTRREESDISFKTINLNFEIGYRVRLLKKLFIQPTIVFNHYLQTFRKETGTITNIAFVYSITPTTGEQITTYYNRTDQTINYNEHFGGWFGLSTRLNVLYAFRIRKREFLVFVFRNFALISDYKLRWWGTGCSVNI